MQQRGKGNFGVEVDHPKFGLITQWFKAEKVRNEYFGNLGRDPAYRDRKFKKVQKD